MVANPSSPAGFGAALRLERQRRSVSLDDISQTTKVTVRNLEALEADEFERIPGGILGKGIVRSYVRFLGLDENEWVTRFLTASGRGADGVSINSSDVASFAINVSSHRIKKTPDIRLRWVGVVALLLLLAGFGWLVWGYVHQRAVSAAMRHTNTSSISTLTPAPAPPVVIRYFPEAVLSIQS
jgi:cytoskeleton protein RodZ